MSTKNTNTTRRQFLKATACTSAMAVAGFSTVAKATNSVFSKSGKTSTITLFNQSDKRVLLDATNPVSLDTVNGWVVVNINKAVTASVNKNSQAISLNAGQTHSFEINSDLAPLIQSSGDYIVITDQYSALNNVIPVSTYDALVA